MFFCIFSFANIGNRRMTLQFEHEAIKVSIFALHVMRKKKVQSRYERGVEWPVSQYFIFHTASDNLTSAGREVSSLGRLARQATRYSDCK